MLVLRIHSILIVNMELNLSTIILRGYNALCVKILIAKILTIEQSASFYKTWNYESPSNI